MLCQSCKKNEATTHIKRVINGKATESHLCKSCAQSLGFDDFFDDFTLNMPSLFSSFFGDSMFALGESRLDRCEKCGCCFDDIIKSGKVGCADCYEKFQSKLMPSIQRIHGKVKHQGKVPFKRETIEAPQEKPKEETAEEKLQKLEAQIKKAIEEQNFEQAAIIRDEIKKLKGEM